MRDEGGVSKSQRGNAGTDIGLCPASGADLDPGAAAERLNFGAGFNHDKMLDILNAHPDWGEGL
jgi:hypothetical protein